MEKSKKEILSDYEAIWSRLCKEITLNELKRLCFDFKLNSIPFKTICWKILLGSFPEHDSEKWIKICNEGRARYHALSSSFKLDPRSSSDLNDNPLSQDKNTVWYRHLCDEELKRIINADVCRTEPGNPYFKDPSVLQMMIDILFCFAREHPDISYKQGMNEILGNVLLAVKDDFDMYRRVTSPSLGLESGGGLNNMMDVYYFEHELLEILGHLTDAYYLEHDLFCLFEMIMMPLQQFYETGVYPNLNGQLPIQTSMHYPAPDSNMSKHLKTVRNITLSVYDSKLDNHLQDLKIEFSVFAIRWLRLLFGREFPREMIFKIWEAIFSYDRQFTLAYYIVTAMIMWVRDELLKNSHDGCLNLLMRYPTLADPEKMIAFALHMREPAIFQNVAGFNCTLQNVVLPRKKIPALYLRKNSTSSDNDDDVVGGVNMLSNRFKRLLSSSPYSSSFRDNRTRHSLSSLSSTSTSTNSTELNKCKSIMAFCKLKVEAVKDLVVADNNSTADDNVGQILNGLEQLSLMLDINSFPVPSKNNAAISEVAEETPVVRPSSPSPITEHMVALNLPPPKTKVNMTVFSCTEQKADSSKFPTENPLQSFGGHSPP